MGPKIYETVKIAPGVKLELAEDTFIGDFCFINVKRLVLGRGSQINSGSRIVGGGEFIAGQYCVVGYGVTVLTGTDTLAPLMADAAPEEKRRIVRGRIELGDNVFIGSGSVVTVSKRCPNLKIGSNAVIGALSYVDRDVPEGTVGWGAPWRPVKKRPLE